MSTDGSIIMVIVVGVLSLLPLNLYYKEKWSDGWMTSGLRRKTEKELEENDRGGSWKRKRTGREREEGNSWKQRGLAFFRGGPELRRDVTGINWNIIVSVIN